MMPFQNQGVGPYLNNFGYLVGDPTYAAWSSYGRGPEALYFPPTQAPAAPATPAAPSVPLPSQAAGAVMGGDHGQGGDAGRQAAASSPHVGNVLSPQAQLGFGAMTGLGMAAGMPLGLASSAVKGIAKLTGPYAVMGGPLAPRPQTAAFSELVGAMRSADAMNARAAAVTHDLGPSATPSNASATARGQFARGHLGRSGGGGYSGGNHAGPGGSHAGPGHSPGGTRSGGGSI